MLRFGLLLIILLYMAFFVCTLFDAPFSLGIISAYAIGALLLLFSSILGRLSYFKYLLALFLTGSLAIILFLFISKRRTFKEIWKKFTPLGLWIYLLFTVYLFINFQNVGLFNIDDLGFWGTHLKDMLRIDAMYTNTEYVVFGANVYPPLSSLVELFFIKIMGGGYSEPNALLAMGSLSFSLLLSLLDGLRYHWKDLVKGLFISLGIIFVTLSVQQNPTMANPSFIYNSLYIDWLLGLELAYAFFALYRSPFDKVSDYYRIGLACILLTLTKQTGIALMLLVSVTLIVRMIILKRFQRKNVMALMLLGILMPLFFFAVWRMYLATYLTYNAGADYGVLSSAAQSLNDERSWKTIGLFLEALFGNAILMHPFQIGYLPLVLLISGILVIFGLIKKYHKDYYSNTIMLMLGSLGYALMILISFLTIFGYEGTYLVMYGRYMQTYTLAMMALTFMIIVNDSDFDRYHIIACLVVLLTVEPNSISSLIYNPNRTKFREKEIIKINQYIREEYDYQKMIVVNQTDMAYLSLLKNTVEEKGENITFIQLTQYNTIAEFQELLKENELLLIGDYDDRFLPFFNSVSDLMPYNNSLYRIIDEDGKLGLELVYTWDE